MSLKRLHATHTRMRADVANDLDVYKKSCERNIREQWRNVADQMFALIPDSLLSLASEFAWTVFDDKCPGPFEDFLVGIAKSEKSGHSISLKEDRFGHCGFVNSGNLMVFMLDLSEAWKTAEVRIFVQPNIGGVQITFIAV